MLIFYDSTSFRQLKVQKIKKYFSTCHLGLVCWIIQNIWKIEVYCSWKVKIRDVPTQSQDRFFPSMFEAKLNSLAMLWGHGKGSLYRVTSTRLRRHVISSSWLSQGPKFRVHDLPWSSKHQNTCGTNLDNPFIHKPSLPHQVNTQTAGPRWTD